MVRRKVLEIGRQGPPRRAEETRLRSVPFIVRTVRHGKATARETCGLVFVFTKVSLAAVR